MAELNDIGIEGLNARLEQVQDEKGWDSQDEGLEFDRFYPDYKEDLEKTIVGVFWKKVPNLVSQKTGNQFSVYVIITPAKEIVAIKDYFMIKKAFSNVKKGDGIKITYFGEKQKKQGRGTYHEFKVSVKKFEADPSPDEQLKEAKTLADADDSEAQNQVECYIEIFKSENFGNEPTPEEIIQLATTDPDLSETDLSRVKAQVARNLKKEGAK